MKAGQLSRLVVAYAFCALSLWPARAQLQAPTGPSGVAVSPQGALGYTPPPVVNLQDPQWGVNCNGLSDTTASINAVVAAAGATPIVVPRNCYVGGTITLGQNTHLVGNSPWSGGAMPSLNYVSIANFLVGPTGGINSGTLSTSNSSLEGLIILASNYAPPTTLRQAYNAAQAFVGTAVTCDTADFAIRNTLIIGFQFPLIATNIGTSAQCDRLVIEQLQGDDTNGLIFQQTGGVGTASGDIPRINNVEWFPFTSFAGGQFESLSVTNVTNSSGLFEVTLASAPPTALTTGDIVQFGPVNGVPSIYTAEPGNGWTINVIDPTHFTLNGSTFAGTYGAAPTAYFSAVWRSGVGLGVTNANTAINIANYFSQSYNTAFYLGAGSGFVSCVNCVSEWQPEATAPPLTYGLDLEGNSDRDVFLGGALEAGVGIRDNSTSANDTVIDGMNSLAGSSHVVQNVQGNLQMNGGSLFPLNFASAITPDVAITSGIVCPLGLFQLGTPITGATGNYICSVPGGLSVALPSTFGSLQVNGNFNVTQTAVGANFQSVIKNTDTTNGAGGQVTVATGVGNAYGFLNVTNAASPTGTLTFGAGITGNVDWSTAASTANERARPNGVTAHTFTPTADVANLAQADQSYTYQAETTGFSYTAPNAATSIVFDPAGALATGTVTFPASPADGQLLKIATSQTITALTVNANSGQTQKCSAPSVSLTQAAPLRCIFRLANTTWYPN